MGQRRVYKCVTSSSFRYSHSLHSTQVLLFLKIAFEECLEYLVAPKELENKKQIKLLQPFQHLRKVSNFND